MNLQMADDAVLNTEMPAYTKRQNLAYMDLTAKHDPPALSLDEQGLIIECSESIETLFGFKHRDFVYRHFSMLFPELAGVDLAQAGRINPLLNYLCRCGHLFHAQNRQGEIFTCSLSISHIGYDGSRLLRMLVRPSVMGDVRSLSHRIPATILDGSDSYQTVDSR